MKYVKLNWKEIKNKGLDTYPEESLIDLGIDFHKFIIDPETSEPCILLTVVDKKVFLEFIAKYDLTFKTLEENDKELSMSKISMEESLENWNY